MSDKSKDKGKELGCYDMSAAEIEFVQAIHAYKVTHNRSTPTWSEVLSVVRGLGYRKVSDGRREEEKDV